MSEFDPILPDEEDNLSRKEFRAVLADPDLRRVALNEPPRPQSPKPSVRAKRKRERQNKKAGRR